MKKIVITALATTLFWFGVVTVLGPYLEPVPTRITSAG